MPADAQTPPVEAPPSPSKLKAMLPFVLAVVLGLGVGGTSGLFVVGPAMARGISPATDAAHGKTAASSPAGDGKAGDTAGAAKQSYTLDNLVLNPAESGGTRFLLLSVVFESSDAKLIDEMKARDAELREVVLVTLGAKTVDQLADMRAREAIKTELTTASLKLFRSRSGVHVYFPQFVIQ